MIMIKKQESGFIFLEIIIAVALMGIVLMTLLQVAFLALNISINIQQTLRASNLMKEEIEALRSYRDGNTWSNFTTVSYGGSNNYYFSLSSGSWVRNSGTEAVSIFSRKVVFDQVYRDGSGNIASSGTLDNDTIKATVTVSWLGKSIQTIVYLTNWQNK